MANLPTVNVETKSRIYQDFSGVDFSNKEVKTYRSPDAVNMWKDYNNSLGKGIETRPGMTKLGEFGLNLLGLFFYNVNDELQVLVHAGTKLYKWDNFPNTPAAKTELFAKMNVVKSQGFVFNNILFIKDGINYLEYNGEDVSEVVGTIPITTTNKTPSGAGESYQGYNLLTGVRKNSFIADGVSTEYKLDTQNLDLDYSVSAVVNGTTIIEGVGLSVDRTTGVVTFDTAPTTPTSPQENNVVITFSKTINGDADKIRKCTLLTPFNNRVFFSGNQDYPNVLFHSELEDPRYITDQAYYNEGMNFTPIKTMIIGNNCLYDIKAPNETNPTIYYHEPTIDYAYGKVYPSTEANISTGCVSTGINFRDDIVFLSKYGLEAISGNLGNERVLAHRSSLVDSKLINEINYEKAQMVEFRGYLVILVNGKLYLADSNQRFQNIDVEYEWYYWELPNNITFIKEYDNNLYLGNEDGTLYKLVGTTDDGVNIESKWSTPNDSFGYEAYRKTTNKSGCVLNIMKKVATLKVEAKTDNGPVDTIEEYEITSASKDYIVCRIKKKKWKTIQLIFSSTSPFGLYMCTLEAFIGGYLKR